MNNSAELLFWGPGVLWALAIFTITGLIVYIFWQRDQYQTARNDDYLRGWSEGQKQGWREESQFERDKAPFPAVEKSGQSNSALGIIRAATSAAYYDIKEGYVQNPNELLGRLELILTQLDHLTGGKQ
jgi:hypothetical protein